MLGRMVRPNVAVLVALVLTAVAQVELWLLWQPDPDEAVGAVALGVRAAAALGTAPLTLSLALGRRLPLLSIVLAVLAIALLPAGPLETSVAVAIAIALAAFRAGEGSDWPAGIGLGVAGVAAVIGVTALVHPGSIDEAGDLALLALFTVGPWLAGMAIRLRRERERDLETAAARAEASRQADAAHAVADERARIARELHDVVAHAISVIVLQARGGRRAIDTDPAAATQALDVIETTATRALGEMRRLVDVLRPAHDAGTLVPPPGLAEIEPLVAGVREAGLDVVLRVEGEPVPLAPGVDLAAYRVVQEALTNTLRHAGAAWARVAVRYLPDAVELEIEDDGTATPPGSSGRVDAASGGRGMVGMRERAALYGGTLEAGRGPGGGFIVRARLPTGGGTPP